MGQKTEMANLDKTAWEHMQEKAAHKLYRIESHDFLFVAMCRITPAKTNLAIFETEQPAVGDGYSMSVVGQIPDHVRWPGKGLVCVDNPVFVFERPGKSIEFLARLQPRHCCAELKLAATKGAPQQSEKLSAELSA